MQYDNIYMFNIDYEDKNGKDAFYKIYSDNKSVYDLEGLPDTTYKIERRHLMKDFDGNFSFTYNLYDDDFFDDTTLDEYWVGKRLTLKDLKNEIDIVTDTKCRKRLKDWYDRITNNVNDRDTIILRLNNNHIIFVDSYPEKIIGFIEGGKVVKQGSQTKQSARTKQPAKYEIDNYIDLE